MKFSCEITGLNVFDLLEQGFSQRRLNAALATGLNRTVYEVKAGATDELSNSIDSPTPYTLRQFRYTKATAQNLSAEVGFDVVAVTNAAGSVQRYEAGGVTPASKYMAPQVEGGLRRAKRFEVALQKAGAMPVGMQSVPGAGAMLDAYGNISRGQITRILSQVATEMTAGHTRSISKEAGKRRKAIIRAGAQYIALPHGRGKLAPGIYAREAFGRNITPVLLFVRSTTYKKRFDFYGVTKRIYDVRLPANVKQAINEHIAKLQRPGTQLSLGI